MYYGLLMPIPYPGGAYLQSMQQTQTSTESGGTNEITATLTNSQKSKFYIQNGAKGEKGDTGAAAGFGSITAEAEILDMGEEPTVSVSVSGGDTDKNLDFTFGLPAGAVVEARGLFGFYIDNTTGDLMLSYSGDDAPDFTINSDGELIYTY